MSIDERVQTAWKEWCGEDIAHPSGAEWIYHQGYMDALASLYRDVSIDKARDLSVSDLVCQTRTGEWFDVTGFSDDLVYVYSPMGGSKIKFSDIRRIIVREIPSPEEVFGEEGR